MVVVEADLTVEIGGETVSVRGYGDRVVVDAPTLSTLRRLADVDATLPVEFEDAAATAGLAVDLRVAGASVARVGPEVGPGVVSRLAGVAPARLSLLGVTRAIVRGGL